MRHKEMEIMHFRRKQSRGVRPGIQDIRNESFMLIFRRVGE